MSKYILRLDDACETMNKKNWERIEKLLDQYEIKPIVGIIPNNLDRNLNFDIYNENFWEKVRNWEEKGWTIAQHGYDHRYMTNQGGINPVHKRSEFAGVKYEIQESKIEQGYQKLLSRGISPKIFYAPSHTFDENTLKALETKTKIKIISDTIANDIYIYNNFYFIPQQVGQVRWLPLKIVTFCYHPNTMQQNDYHRLELFLKKNRKKFINFNEVELKNRKLNFFDKILHYIYFMFRRKR